MDREVVHLARVLGVVQIIETFQLVEKRLKDSPVPDEDKAKMWDLENAQARMVLKQKVYEILGRVRETIRSQQTLYATLESGLKDYCEKIGGDAHIDLPKMMLDEYSKLVWAYGKLQRNINGDDDDDILFKLKSIRRELKKIIRNNPPWQQVFDSVHVFLHKAGNQLTMLDPKFSDWKAVAVEGLPEKPM